MIIVRNAEVLLNDDLFPGDDTYLCLPIHGTDKYRVFSGEDARIYQQILEERELEAATSPTTPTTPTMPATPTTPQRIMTPRGRYAKSEATLWRHKPDGTYDDRPRNPDKYFTEYYHQFRGIMTQCDVCGRTTTLNSMSRHKKSLLGARMAKKLEANKSHNCVYMSAIRFV